MSGPIGSRRWTALLALAAAATGALPAHAGVELQLQQPDGKPLAGAVLYAVPLDGRRVPPPQPAVMDQRDRRFVPQVLPVQTGAEVGFPNTDSISHHVYSFSPAKRFELYLPKGEKGRPAARGGGEATRSTVVFDRAGVVALGCNIHDWMLAYIVVLDTPWFAQTDSQGRAALSPPAGRYRLAVWHPRIAEREPHRSREETLDPAQPLRWPLRLSQPLLPARDQEPGFSDY